MKKTLALLAFIIILITLYTQGFYDFLSLQCIQENKELLITFTSDYCLLTIFFIFISFIIVSNFHVPLAGILLIMLCGTLFGKIGGLIIAVIGATLGSLSAFYISRYFFHDHIQNRYAEKLKEFNNHLKNNGFWYLLFLRFTPLVPQQTLTVLSGLSKINIGAFFWSTFLGTLPFVLIYSMLGNIIWDITDVKNLMSLKIIIFFYLLCVAIILPLLFLKIRNNHKKVKS